MRTYSMSSSTYTTRYIELGWSNRSQLEGLELKGLYATSLIILNSALEGLVVRYLQWMLQVNDTELHNLLKYKNYERALYGEKVEIGLRSEYEYIMRGKEKLKQQLEKANFGQLDELNKAVTGSSLRLHIGTDLFESWNALNTLRNVVAHGRQLKANLDPKKDSNITFENTQLELVEKYLNINGLFPEEHNSDTFEVVLNENVVSQFSKDADKIMNKYVSELGPVVEKFNLAGVMPPLPKFAI